MLCLVQLFPPWRKRNFKHHISSPAPNKCEQKVSGLKIMFEAVEISVLLGDKPLSSKSRQTHLPGDSL